MELHLHGVVDQDHAAAKSHKPTRTPAIQRKSSFKDIQSAVSRIKPEILKSVIAAAGAGAGFAAKQNANARPSPAATAAPRCLGGAESTAPLTIFYSGKVVVVDLTPDKANSILRLAEKGGSDDAGVPAATVLDQVAEKEYDHVFSKPDEGDLPIARRRSLQRFLQSRKKRLIMPTACMNEREKPILVD